MTEGVFAGYAERDGSKDRDAPISRSVHLQGDWDEVLQA